MHAVSTAGTACSVSPRYSAYSLHLPATGFVKSLTTTKSGNLGSGPRVPPLQQILPRNPKRRCHGPVAGGTPGSRSRPALEPVDSTWQDP